MCGIIGVFKHEGEANVEIYEGLLMLQHRGQDSGACLPPIPPRPLVCLGLPLPLPPA